MAFSLSDLGPTGRVQPWDGAEPRISTRFPDLLLPDPAAALRPDRAGPGRSAPPVRLRFEAVADAPDGGDPAGPVRVVLDLLADAAHVLGDGGRVLPGRRRGPHVLEQLVPGEDLAGGR